MVDSSFFSFSLNIIFHHLPSVAFGLFFLFFFFPSVILQAFLLSAAQDHALKSPFFPDAAVQSHFQKSISKFRTQTYFLHHSLGATEYLP